MVDLELPTPNNSAALLSTSESAPPHLTINHDVAADLDSTNAFEGPEKLLEVWFAPSPSALPAGVTSPLGLKAIPSKNWEAMLDMVNCKVLSVVSSDTMDAYLLSESSMFVFPHKLILKTCGTTTLLLGLHKLLRVAAADGGFPSVVKEKEEGKAMATPYRVFYSRKNFLFPDRQRGPHRSWKQEVKFLDDMFEGGSAYMVGRMNGDHWYLYITSPNASILTPPRTPPGEEDHAPQQQQIPTALVSKHLSGGGVGEEDETLEILMTDLDQERAKQFYLEHASEVAARQRKSNDDGIFDVDDVNNKTDELTTEGHALGTVVSDSCGLSEVYPKSRYADARIDAYMFAPCGFSANGVVPAPDEGEKSAHYFTVHVTPEPHCSFASFETNVPGGQNGRETSEIIAQVVDIFRPGRFSVTLFEGKSRALRQTSPAEETGLDEAGGKFNKLKRIDQIPGYRRIERIVHDFDDYDLIFRFYEREGWTGAPGARLGEDF